MMDTLVLLAVHGILSRQRQYSNACIFFISFFLNVHDSQQYVVTGNTRAITILVFVVTDMSLPFQILFSPVIAALPSAILCVISALQSPFPYIVEPSSTKLFTSSTFSPLIVRELQGAMDNTFVF